MFEDLRKTMFEIGKNYTREEIHGELGGGKQPYLPSVSNVVVAGCFKRSKNTNPDAPNVILPGFGTRREKNAKLFAMQGNAIPTFVKIVPNQWEYVGQYKVKHHSFDMEEIRKYALKANRVDDVSSVLFLEKESV